MKTTTSPSLHIKRTFKAPRDRVYDVWTDLKLAKHWWGPDGTTTHELTIDQRVGGRFRWVVSSPETGRITAQGEFREVQPREKLVYTWQWTDDPDGANAE